MGQSDGLVVRHLRRRSPPARLRGRETLLAHAHVPPQPTVRRLLSPGLCPDPRLPLVPLSVRSVGYHHR